MLDPALGAIFGSTPLVPRTAAQITADLMLPLTVEHGECRAALAQGEACWPEFGQAWMLYGRTPRSTVRLV